MREVKRIFNDRHQECDIEQLPQYNHGKYKLGEVISPIVYSVDCLFDKDPRRGGRRCDEFIFFDSAQRSTGIYLIERKDNNSNNISKIIEQLQGGAGFIEDFLNDDPAADGEPFDFMPVWVSRGVKASTRKKLMKIRILLRGRNKPIKQIHTKGTLPKLA